MKNSSLGTTMHIPLDNASLVNREEHERAIEMYMKMMEEKDRKIRSAPQLNESPNEFLEIPEEITGEWQGAKSVLQGLQNLLKWSYAHINFTLKALVPS